MGTCIFSALYLSGVAQFAVAQGLSTTTLKHDYIYLNGKLIAIENSTPSPVFQLANTTHPQNGTPNFIVGDGLTVTISGAQPNAAVTVTRYLNGNLTAGSPNFYLGDTDGSGNFSLSGTEYSTSVGTWDETWYVSGIQITHITFIVYQASAAPFLPNRGYYEIVNRNSGKVLDVTNWSTDNGTQIQQWDYLSGGNQQWQFVATSDGYYEIINRNSGKALDVTNWSTDNGTRIQQWDYLSGTNQQWQFVPTSNGYYEVVNLNSGKVLDVENWSTDNGGAIQQWDYLGGANQQWQFVPVT